MFRFAYISVLIFFAAGPAFAQDRTEHQLARATLHALQAPSFAKQKEFCGYIGYNEHGELVATKANLGTVAGCVAILPDKFAPTASYHTHGDFDFEYLSEIPSDIDIEGDARERVNGYISTPGGRLWFVDSRKMEVRQLCGMGCLPVAPNFVKGADGEIALRYSYEALLRKLNE